MPDADYPDKIVVDIDGTLCPIKKQGQEYADLVPDPGMVEALARWRAKGFQVTLFTARNMRTHDGNMGRINKHTAPVLIDWLERHGIEYDEIIFGKPWPGPRGFYVDDRSVRPDEFLSMTEEELRRTMDDSQCRESE